MTLGAISHQSSNHHRHYALILSALTLYSEEILPFCLSSYSPHGHLAQIQFHGNRPVLMAQSLAEYGMRALVRIMSVMG